MGTPKKYTPEILKKLAVEMLEWFALKENYWLKDFAINRGIWWQRFVEFADECEEFAEALKICKDMQESKLVKIGLSKNQNVAMAIFALKNVAGWRDTLDFKHMGEVRVKTVENMTEEELLADIDRILGKNGVDSEPGPPAIATTTGPDSPPNPPA